MYYYSFLRHPPPLQAHWGVAPKNRGSSECNVKLV